MPGLLGLLEKVATCNGLRAFEIFLFQGKLWVQQGGLVSYLAARLDTVGVQVKVGSRLAPYPIQELVQADRLHLLLVQLKELKKNVRRRVLDQVILLLFLLLQGAKVYLNAVIQFHAPIDEAVLMWASYAVFKTSNVDKFEIN